MTPRVEKPHRRHGEYAARIAETSRQDGACRLWTGDTTDSGYGRMHFMGRHRRAHVVSFILTHGHEPTDLVLHTCDNRLCVNPEHLYDGTQKQNMADMWSRGRGMPHATPKYGQTNPASKLTDSDVCIIRGMLSDGHPRREIALRFGITTSTVGDIARGRRRVLLSPDAPSGVVVPTWSDK